MNHLFISLVEIEKFIIHSYYHPHRIYICFYFFFFIHTNLIHLTRDQIFIFIHKKFSILPFVVFLYILLNQIFSLINNVKVVLPDSKFQITHFLNRSITIYNKNYLYFPIVQMPYQTVVLSKAENLIFNKNCQSYLI